MKGLYVAFSYGQCLQARLWQNIKYVGINDKMTKYTDKQIFEQTS